MTKLEDYKSSAPAITGSSTINHAARVKLGLNCSEYCLLDFMSRREESKHEMDSTDVYTHLGFSTIEIQAMLRMLITKGFIRADDYKYTMTDKWSNGFADIEKEFDNLFWRKDGKVCWTGTRKKALEYWIRIRKKHSMVFLVSQRDKYFEFLELQKKFRGFDQQKVMCQVFLNPANERYLEDYTDYVDQLKAKYAPPVAETKPVTKEDILKAYAKDNNEQGNH